MIRAFLTVLFAAISFASAPVAKAQSMTAEEAEFNAEFWSAASEGAKAQPPRALDEFVLLPNAAAAGLVVQHYLEGMPADFLAQSPATRLATVTVNGSPDAKGRKTPFLIGLTADVVNAQEGQSSSALRRFAAELASFHGLQQDVTETVDEPSVHEVTAALAQAGTRLHERLFQRICARAYGKSVRWQIYCNGHSSLYGSDARKLVTEVQQCAAAVYDANFKSVVRLAAALSKAGDWHEAERLFSRGTLIDERILAERKRFQAIVTETLTAQPPIAPSKKDYPNLPAWCARAQTAPVSMQ